MARLKSPYRRFWISFPIILALTGAMAVLGLHRLKINVDILSVLPDPAPGLADMRPFLSEHPVSKRIYIDIADGAASVDPATLEQAAGKVRQALQETGLIQFQDEASMISAFSVLSKYIHDQQPYLLTSQDFSSFVPERLTDEVMDESLRDARKKLSMLGNDFNPDEFARDPFGLSEPAYQSLSSANPAPGTTIRNGVLINKDGRRALLIGSLTAIDEKNSVVTKTIFDTITGLQSEFASNERTSRININLVGGFRSADDNERAARGDIKRVSIVATIGLILIVALTFRRRPLGLASFLPPLFGAAAALLAYSFFRPSIHALSLGFGGAIIGTAINHAIGFTIYLEDCQPCRGRDAARALWKVAGLSSLTTIVAFGMMVFSGFPLMVEIGLFTALCDGFSFLFVHIAFRFIFNEPLSQIPLVESVWDRTLKKIRRKVRGRWLVSLATMIVIAILGIWMRPPITMDLASMNTVSPETLDAEKTLQTHWSWGSRNRAVMVETMNENQLLDKAGAACEGLTSLQSDGTILSWLDIYHIFPSRKQADANMKAWREFWTPDLVRQVRERWERKALENGFAPEAFDAFWNKLEKPDEFRHPPVSILAAIGLAYRMNDGHWTLILPFSSKSDHNVSKIFHTLRNAEPSAILLDEVYYAEALGEQLGHVFIRMTGWVAVSIFFMLIIAYRRILPVLLAYLPISFSLGGTFLVLKMTGRPFGLPSIMLGIVLLGFGIDYALYVIRAFESADDETHVTEPFLKTIGLSAATTLIGFGAMLFSKHNMLLDCGLTLCLGVGLSYLAAAWGLPPILRRMHFGHSKADDGLQK